MRTSCRCCRASTILTFDSEVAEFGIRKFASGKSFFVARLRDEVDVRQDQRRIGRWGRKPYVFPYTGTTAPRVTRLSGDARNMIVAATSSTFAQPAWSALGMA
jgi:hypothetical protein